LACDMVYNFLHSFTLHAFLSALISSTLGATLSTLPKRISYEAYHQIKMNFDVSNLDYGTNARSFAQVFSIAKDIHRLNA